MRVLQWIGAGRGEPAALRDYGLLHLNAAALRRESESFELALDGLLLRRRSGRVAPRAHLFAEQGVGPTLGLFLLRWGQRWAVFAVSVRVRVRASGACICAC